MAAVASAKARLTAAALLLVAACLPTAVPAAAEGPGNPSVAPAWFVTATPDAGPAFAGFVGSHASSSGGHGGGAGGGAAGGGGSGAG